MRFLLALMVLISDAARAEVITSIPQITPAGDYSCRILRHRVRDRVKGHVGLHALLLQMDKRGGWNAKGMKRLQAQLGRSGYFPKDYFQPSVKVSVRFTLNAEWSAVMNSAVPVGVRWSFKDIQWEEERGILPDEVQSIWRAPDIEVSTWITPVQLCFGSPDLRLSVKHADRVLELQSQVDWP